jgi:hypothetical protein
MEMTAYEKQRDARIAQNKARLNELNIPQVPTTLHRRLSSSFMALGRPKRESVKAIT